MKNLGIVVDVAKCTGCYSCFLACKDEYCGEAHPGHTLAQPMKGQQWMNIIEVERGTFPKVKVDHIPIACMQCEDAPCVAAAENGAVYRRDDGIVMIDPVKAKGQKQIANACPYRVIFWNEAENIAQKCNMCSHLIDGGYKNPRCVELCPTGCLTFGDLNDPQSEVAKLVAAQKPTSLRPEFGLQEKVLYVNVPKKFVSGTVIVKETDMCAENITVALKGNGVDRTAVTDAFGDFWFEGLENATDYTVEIAHKGFKNISLKVRTYRDVVIQEIFLEKTA
jgi:Fe-S-cluster-containing dehydrogenase component